MLLTLADVLDARQHYHVHLAHLPNVVETAIGRYLIHEKDWYATHEPNVPRKTAKPASARTLFNSRNQGEEEVRRPALILPTQWTPEQAVAVFEILDELRDRVWSLYGQQIQQAMREDQRTTSPKPRRAIGQRDLPF